MKTTASSMAVCNTAKLRVSWTVTGWAPAVYSTLRSSLFQSTTTWPLPVWKADQLSALAGTTIEGNGIDVVAGGLSAGLLVRPAGGG